MNELREHIKTLAQQEGKTELEIVTQLQAGAALLDDGEATLDALCDIKDELLGLAA